MNYYIEEAYYPTVKELLKLPIFSTSYLAAGESGLNRTVSGINLSDNPDYGQWISPGELMISTCFSVYQDPDAMNAYYSYFSAKPDGRILHQTFTIPRQRCSPHYDPTSQ